MLALTTGGPSSCLALTPPNPVEFGGTPAPDGGVVTPRGAFVTALNNFTITAVGVEGDLTVPSLTLVANIYAASGLTRGTLLATASRTLTDAGVGFYDVPINFTFNAGTDYDISLSFAPAADLLVRFFEFDPVNFASPPFDIGGVVRVRDGEADNGVSANFVLPHLRLCLGSAPVPPTVTITANDADAGEPSNNGQFTVARTGSTAAPLTVNFTVGGTASSGVDYTSIGTSVIIPATAASAVVNVTVIDDLLVEASETVIATLAANAAYTVDSPSSATVTIGDNDTACLSELKNLRDVRLNFGGVATTCPATVAGGQLVAGTFDCDMSNPAGSTARHRVAIGFRTSSGQGIGQIREIPSLNSVPSCPLTVRNDVTLPADVGVDTTPGTYSLWVESYLTENDPTVLFAANPHTAEDNLRKILCVVTVPLPTVTITASDSNAAEPSDPGQFTVTRTGSTASPLTVNFTVGGTASSGADYTAIGTSVVIPATAASAVINVNVIDDLLVEGSETVVATLAANAAYTVGSPASATVTITDNDAPAGPVPVARWRFDETSGATALDSIGVNHGTLINGPLRVAGINNGALSFDGVNDYVNVPDAAALDLPAACSISLWIKPASLLNASSGRKDLLKKFLAYWILLNYPSNDGKLTFVLQSGSPTVKTLTSSWAANTWYHIVCTHDGAQIKIYVNGVHEATTTTTILIPNNANPLQIGGNSDQSFWFPSVIDEVRLYHSALSVAQVQSLYGNPGASSPALSIVLQRELITSGAMDAGAPGAKIILRWNAEPGRVYRVQFTDRLNDPEWQEVPVSIKPEGTSGLYEDKTATPAQRFYRVIEVP